MTAGYISSPLRQKVRRRAEFKCEYCLLPEAHAFFPHEPDHIIALKHGGGTTETNLALACFDCNRFKGSDISSIDTLTKKLTPLFNPRSQKWKEHFNLQEGAIIAITNVGRVTERLLQLNLAERVEVRHMLVKCRLYPEM